MIKYLVHHHYHRYHHHHLQASHLSPICSRLLSYSAPACHRLAPFLPAARRCAGDVECRAAAVVEVKTEVGQVQR